MIGEKLSHFKVVDKLGAGGMGVVYRGVDLNLIAPWPSRFCRRAPRPTRSP